VSIRWGSLVNLGQPCLDRAANARVSRAPGHHQASRARVVGQFLSEALVLAAIGGVLGIGVAFIGSGFPHATRRLLLPQQLEADQR
jgi:hypothetical protein